MQYNKLMRSLQKLLQNTTMRLILITLTFLLSLVAVGTYADMQIVDYTPEGATPMVVDAGLLRPFHALNRWDANHYKYIAENGYSSQEVAFFPVYPLLVRGVMALGVPVYAALLVVSWVFCLLTVVILFQWFRFEVVKRKLKMSPWAPMLLFAIFPTSFFLGLGYSEGVFIFFSTLSLYAYRRKWYWIAAIAIAVSTATRVQGGALAVFFLVDFLIDKKRNIHKLIPVLFAGIGVGAYMLYLWKVFGNPLEFIAVQKSWGRLSGNPIQNLLSSFTPVYLWYLPVLGAGLYAVWKQLGVKWLAYALVFILIPIFSGRLDSLNRYMLALPVIFLALAMWFQKHDRVKIAYIITASFLLCWNIILFCNEYWVA